ncbi:hypothetical protein [Kineococcus indalonis]|uniref:hypothetical protein n=1 Tax=Kineococcus indalonis TaxID=2696566 RepID=UPI0014131317|nr:hypothetical protein [Kineococcus indalonis]NAZ87055.1 hypothetical protein [Kineococcus indalonis]
MTSTLNGMDRHRRAAVRALLVQRATPTTSPAALAGSPHDAAGRSPVRRPAWRRPELALTSAAGLTAAALAVVVTASVSRPLPAYAVSGGGGEDVTVEVNRLEGEQALQDALRERGIAADITYLPSGTACRSGRYAEDRAPGLSLSVSAERFEVQIPAGAVGEGETFVLSASVTPLDDGVQAAVDFGVARGAIAPCTVVDAP